MRDILDWVQTQQEPRHQQSQASDQPPAEATAAARALEIATASTAPASARLFDDTPTTPNSLVNSAPAAAASSSTTSEFVSEFVLPSLQERLGVHYAELPSFLMSMVDYNGPESSSDGGSAGAASSRFFPSNRQRQASGSSSSARQHNQEYNHTHFALGDDWSQLPSSLSSYDNDNLQFSSMSTMYPSQHSHQHSHISHQNSRLDQQLQYIQQRHRDATSRLAGVRTFTMLRHAPPPSGPPQEIDLTVSSSESSDEGDDESATGSQATTVLLERSDDEDIRGYDDQGDVEILQTTRAASAAALGGGGSPSARYLTYSSLPPLRRKRRRQENEDGTTAPPGDPAVNAEMFDGQRAESTNVSMENNETIERFKNSLKCSICLDVIEEMTSTICGHIYCGKCIRLAIRVTAKCPLCQRKLRPKDVHPLYF